MARKNAFKGLIIFISFCLAAIAVVFNFIELALGLIAIIPFYILMHFSIRYSSVEVRALSIAFMFGNIICWVVGFLGYFYFLVPQGLYLGQHTVVTMVLINLMTWGILGGSLMALPPKRKPKNYVVSIELYEKQIGIMVKTTLPLLVVFTALFFKMDIPTKRLETGLITTPGSKVNLLLAASVIQYLAFFFMGMHLTRSIFSIRGVIYIIILCISAISMSLSGGRLWSILRFIYFLAGMLYSKLPKREIAIFVVFAIICSIILFTLIGSIRSDRYEEFFLAQGGDRVQMIHGEFNKVFADRSDSYNYTTTLLFARIAEPSGQLVIDAVADGKQHIGFKNFERIITGLIPKIIYPNKLPLEDGPERLVEYGLNISDFNSIPLTFMADAFERGGYLSVFAIALIASFLFTKIGIFISRFKNFLFKSCLIVHLTMLSLRLYTATVLGSIFTLAYLSFRDFLIITLIFFFSKLFTSISKKRV